MGSLGWPEILIILVIALIIFGPRKLPELGKTLGQSLAQFRRASEDFKRTWETEVEMEKNRLDSPPPATVDVSNVPDPFTLGDDSPSPPGETVAQTDGNGKPDGDSAIKSLDGVEAPGAETHDDVVAVSVEGVPPPPVGVVHADEAKRDIA